MKEVRERLAEIYGNRKWILTNTISAGMPHIVKTMRDWDSETMVVAGSPGIGEQPNVPIVYTGSGGNSILTAIREFLATLADPPPEVMAEVDRFDAEGSAGVLLPIFATEPDVLDRKAYGVRPRRWSALEDKIAALEVFEQAGIPMAPYRVVPVADAPRAAGSLSSELGSVWVADNKEGWHGGAEYLRWVTDSDSEREALRFFETRADRVRIMPFLDGIPCSIHGWVGGSSVAVFRPVEVLVFRVPGPGLKYAGVSTRWDPPQPLREEMRAAARAVGEVLRERHRYRGPFGIDGIATEEGFRPTELNPRLATGLGAQLGSVDIPLGLVLRAIIEGDLELDPTEIEIQVVQAGDADRSLSSWIVIPGDHQGEKTGVKFDDGVARAVDADDDNADGTLELGPSAPGSAVMVKFDPERVGVGEPMAPLVAAAAELAVELWDVDIPPLEPAPDLTANPGAGSR